jgi:hypothetical protein
MSLDLMHASSTHSETILQKGNTHHLHVHGIHVIFLALRDMPLAD